jgi:hypothetical protein
MQNTYPPSVSAETEKATAVFYIVISRYQAPGRDVAVCSSKQTGLHAGHRWPAGSSLFSWMYPDKKLMGNPPPESFRIPKAMTS